MNRFSEVIVRYEVPGLSDHCPLIVKIREDTKGGGRPFRFFNHLAEHSRFEDIVREEWDKSSRGVGMERICHKLKQIQYQLKKLHKEEGGSISRKLEESQAKLEEVQRQLQLFPHDVGLQIEEKEAIAEVRKWLTAEHSIIRQKSRIQWLQIGDSNVKFFHASIKARSAHNRIDQLKDENGQWIEEPDRIQEMVRTFYKSLLGTAAENLQGLDIPCVRKGRKLTREAGHKLIQPVTRREVDEAIRDIHSEKAPGPDGFNSFFFKKSWKIIGGEVYDAVVKFFEEGRMCRKINLTSITLIPKVMNPSEVKQYRPISCCNVVYKIIAKVLTARLREVIGDIIDPGQSGFIPDRQILDNVLLASELIKGYGRKGISPRCMLKIDLRKAYDSIEWPFLQAMMYELGFPDQFVKWVMECVSSVSYAVMVNGMPVNTFQAAEGLRQGDPMSPYLFAIGM